MAPFVRRKLPRNGSRDKRSARRLLGFLRAQFGNFAQKPLLNLPLHFDAVKLFAGRSWHCCKPPERRLRARLPAPQFVTPP
jgi:hypothetical protein